VWASKGSPTIYDAIFPNVVEELMELAGVEHHLEDEEYANILSQNARLAGLMDISEKANLFELRKQVASDIGITVDKLAAIMEPVESVYAIADHSRCLTFMLGDGIIPSNVKAGYLARLVIRRTLKMMQDRGIRIPLSEIVQMHIRNLPEYPEFAERFDVIEEILAGEEKKFQETLERGKKMIQKSAKHYKKNNEKMPLEAIIEMYDSHGIPPEISKDAASEVGVEVDLPDTFYSLVANKHSKRTKEEKEEVPFADRLNNLPATKRLFYDEPHRFDFEAVVLDIFDNNIVLDNTLFYPEGGGQPADHGTLTVEDVLLNVVDVQMIDGIVIHTIDDIEDELHIRKGDLVNGKVDETRRMAHARHHTATHVVNDAAREVLGDHIWQAGAQKFTDRARLDLSHYKRISQEEIEQIEILANRLVMENKRILSEWMDRTEAEQKYGFGLYQGGVPPGKKIRVLHVGNDIEACAGTHCTNTGQIGPIKILKTERIQDGVERIEYAAGEAAVLAMQQMDNLIRQSAETLRVPAEQLPATTERFFEEWKTLRKENEKLKEELATSRVSQLVDGAEDVSGVRLITEEIPCSDAEGLTKMVKQLSAENSDLVTLLLSDNAGVKVAASAGKDAIQKGANAGLIVREVTAVVGGGGGGKPDLAQGGGTDPSKIKEALVAGKEALVSQIQGKAN